MKKNRVTTVGGFTLIELLIVIIIIGILAAIAIPMFLGQRDKAKESAVKGGVHNIELGIASYAVDNGDTYPARTTSAGSPWSTTVATATWTTGRRIRGAAATWSSTPPRATTSTRRRATPSRSWARQRGEPGHHRAMRRGGA